MTDPVLLEISGSVATLRLNRPERRNAISLAMRRQLGKILDHVNRDQSIRALILCGSGGSFCAGGDIRDMQSVEADGETARQRMREAGGLAITISTLDIPVIAAVDGSAYGAGFGLALAADIVLATPQARFCASFARLGLVPDFGLHHSLPRRVGVPRAKDIVFSAREIAADEALQLGIVDRVHPANTLEKEARALADSFTGGSRTALGQSKALLNQSITLDIRQVTEAETAAQALCFTTEFHNIARQRFLTGSKT